MEVGPFGGLLTSVSRKEKGVREVNLVMAQVRDMGCTWEKTGCEKQRKWAAPYTF